MKEGVRTCGSKTQKRSTFKGKSLKKKVLAVQGKKKWMHVDDDVIKSQRENIEFNLHQYIDGLYKQEKNYGLQAPKI